MFLFTRLLFLLFSIIPTIHSVTLPSVYIRNYDKDDYKAAYQNWDITVSDDGILYVANGAGLLSYDGNNWRLFPLPDESEVLQIHCSKDTVYCRSENAVGFWLPDELGGMVYSPLETIPQHIQLSPFAGEYPFPLPAGIEEAQPTAVVEMEGHYYIGTSKKGLYVVDELGNILSHITDQTFLQDNVIHELECYRKKQLYIAYDNGLAIVDFYPAIRNLGRRSRIGKLTDAVLADSVLYIQTNTGYFRRNIYENEFFTLIPYPQAKIFFNRKNEINHNMVIDNSYWISDSLAWVIKGNEVSLIKAEKDSISLNCRLLLDNYGLSIVSRDPRIFPLNDSLHLFSTVQGAILVNTERLIRGGRVGEIPDRIPHRITQIEYLTREDTFHIPYNKKEIALPHNFQRVNIFVGSSVFTPNNQISYKLDEVTADWSAWQKDGKISLLQLPEGRYTLRIRKYVPTGDFPEIQVSLVISPPWYNTLTAYLVYVSLIWLVIHLSIRIHLHNKKRVERRRVELERREEEQRLEKMKNELLENELRNKTNELLLQTSLLVQKSRLMSSLIEELDSQKETLGERYPNKLYKRLRSMLESSMNDQGDWLAFESYFNSAHQNFIERLQQLYADITPGDIRLCCLLRMNLSTKEVASILNVSVRAIELRRYRLRKKMGLEGDTNLVDYLMSF